MSLIPLFHKRLATTFTAIVDDELAELISRYTWSLMSPTVPMPPRAFDRRYEPPIFLQLNRLVYLLSTTEPAAREALVADGQMLYSQLSLLPRIRFLDNNPFNCQLSNLSATVARSARPQKLNKQQAAADARLLMSQQLLASEDTTPLEYDPLEAEPGELDDLTLNSEVELGDRPSVVSNVLSKLGLGQAAPPQDPKPPQTIGE